MGHKRNASPASHLSTRAFPRYGSSIYVIPHQQVDKTGTAKRLWSIRASSPIKHYIYNNMYKLYLLDINTNMDF